MPGRRRRTEVDPDELDRAAREMRKMAVRDFHAADDFGKALTERAGADRAFGNSQAARQLAQEWDNVIRSRVKEADDLGERTREMAEDLERTADAYRENEADKKGEFDDIEGSIDGHSGD